MDQPPSLTSHKKYVYGFVVLPIKGLKQNECIKEAVAGGLHTLLLTDKGRFLVSGHNLFNQLGLPEKQIFYGFKVCTMKPSIDTIEYKEEPSQENNNSTLM